MQKVVLQTKNEALTIDEDGDMEYTRYGEVKYYNIYSFDKVVMDAPKLLKKGIIAFDADEEFVFGIWVPYSQRYAFCSVAALIKELHDNVIY